jgi:hypothetical protein
MALSLTGVVTLSVAAALTLSVPCFALGLVAIYLAQRVNDYSPVPLEDPKDEASKLTFSEVVERFGVKRMREEGIFPRRFLKVKLPKAKEFYPNYEKISAIKFEGTEEETRPFEGTEEETRPWKELCGKVLVLENERKETESKIDRLYPTRQEKLMASVNKKESEARQEYADPKTAETRRSLNFKLRGFSRERDEIRRKDSGRPAQRDYDNEMRKEERTYEEALWTLEKEFRAFFKNLSINEDRFSGNLGTY